MSRRKARGARPGRAGGSTGSSACKARLLALRAALFAALLPLGAGMAGPAAAQGDAAAREGLARTLATRLFGPETGAELGPVTPAARWRLLDGPRLRGDLRMSADAAAQTRRYGFFAFELRGQGVFEGIFNVKPGGRRVVGVFWPDGRLNQGQAAGFLDLEADAQGVGRGGVTFIAGESLDGVTAR